MIRLRTGLLLLLAILIAVACGPPPRAEQGRPGQPVAPTAAPPMDSQPEQLAPGELPIAFTRFTDNVTVRVEGDVVIIESDGVPPHPSPYFPQSDSRYQPYDSPGFAPNPGQISSYQATYRLPLNPQPASQLTQTPLGIMGVALDGVALFNQYAVGRAPLTHEIASFDQYNGHPQQEGLYHYHLEPLYLTELFGDEALVGFLLDGYPVYGPMENGAEVKNSELDEYHGHSHPTPEYPEGRYHYHVTAEEPYINGVGYYGVTGTVSCNPRCGPGR